MLNKISSTISRHKIAVAFAIVFWRAAAIMFMIFFTATDGVRYVMATANKGILIISVSVAAGVGFKSD